MTKRPMGDRSTAADLARSRGRTRDVTVPGICWRCGVPFTWTTDDVLRRCAELARAAS